MKKVTRAIAAMMLTVAVVFATGCKKSDEPSNGGNNNGGGTSSNYKYVDLGLPSGTLWATCNVGATTPEGYGDYFAWGETQPKTIYDWSTYKWCNGGYDQITKYCDDSYYGYNGFTDNLTVLQAGDDAATANWGSGWCMPTREQWKELIDNTTNAWTTRNGVNGVLFTASNGKSLFMSATGDRWDLELGDAGFYGLYWSRSFSSSYEARTFFFDSHGCGVGFNGRERGLSVRAVREN